MGFILSHSPPMFVFIIVEQNNNRFDESEKG
jgi:hypothetical protein